MAKVDLYIGANKRAVEALIQRNLSLMSGLTEEAKKKVITSLTDGLIKGAGIDELVDNLLKEGLGWSQSKAETVARTEIMYGLNQGTIKRYWEDGIEWVEWLAGPDDRCCEYCKSQNGKHWETNKAPVLPAHPNCRCTWVPYFPPEPRE